MAGTKIAKILIDRGTEANLPFGFALGRLYLTTDTHKLFAGQGLSSPLVQITGNNAGLNFRGAWTSLATYLVNDLVTFDNTLYIALGSSTNEEPDLFPAAWDVVISPSFSDTDFYNYVQSSPSSTWVITHNLNVPGPSVVVQDSTNTQILVETHFDNSNQVTLKFSAPESGVATVNI